MRLSRKFKKRKIYMIVAAITVFGLLSGIGIFSTITSHASTLLGTNLIGNGSFENFTPTNPAWTATGAYNGSDLTMDPWQSIAQSGGINGFEVWKSGATVASGTAGFAFNAYDGNYLAELNASATNNDGTYYQTISLSPNTIYEWQVNHRGRYGQDTADVNMGTDSAMTLANPIISASPNGSTSLQMKDGKQSWNQNNPKGAGLPYSGFYCPGSGTLLGSSVSTYFAIASVAVAPTSAAATGNLIDDCSLVAAATGQIATVQYGETGALDDLIQPVNANDISNLTVSGFYDYTDTGSYPDYDTVVSNQATDISTLSPGIHLVATIVQDTAGNTFIVDSEIIVNSPTPSPSVSPSPSLTPSQSPSPSPSSVTSPSALPSVSPITSPIVTPLPFTSTPTTNTTVTPTPSSSVINVPSNSPVTISTPSSDWRPQSTVQQSLETDDHIRYIQGYPSDQGVIDVKPDNDITRGEVAMIFFRLLKDTNKNAPVPNTFTDVNSDSWYVQGVCYLTKIGILKGYSDSTFKPDQPITRAEFTDITARFSPILSENSSPFNDVETDYWAFNYIVTAYEKGWITGYPDGTFKPDDNITRAEAVTIVNKMLGRRLLESDVPSALDDTYADLPVSYWAFADIIEASYEHDYSRAANGYEIWSNYWAPDIL